MSKDYRETLEQLLKDSSFKAEYDALEQEFKSIRIALQSETAKDSIEDTL